MPSAMRSTGTYVDAKTGKKTVVGPRPLKTILKKPLFLLLLLPSLAFGQQQDMRVRAFVTNVSSAGVSAAYPLYITWSGQYGSGYAHFEHITPPNGLSAQCAARLYRNSSSATDNFTGANGVFGIEFDVHVRKNTLGSRQEATK